MTDTIERAAQRQRVVRGAIVAAGALTGAAMYIRSLRAGRPPYPDPPGVMVEVDGQRLHTLHNTAGSGPTVVFEHALACPSTEWGWVARALDGRSPYLVYDRPGTGWSDTADRRPQTAAELNDLTRALLKKLGLPGPYVLVGHSVGGLLIRTFAARFPGDVAGLVLVDSTHPDQIERSGLQRETLPLVGQGIFRACWRAWLGILRPEDPDLGEVREAGATKKLPEPLAAPTVALTCHPEPWRGARHEFKQWLAHWREETRAGTLPPGLPVAVLTAAYQAAGDPAHGRMQRELAGLTTVGRHHIVPRTSHESLVMEEEHAGNIVEMVDWVIERSGAGVGREPTA